MTYSNYPHGFSNGLSVREIPLVLTTNPKGNVFWVNSSADNSSDNNKGTNQYPLNTLAKAISLCSENQGDTIMLGQGHTESIAAATSIDKAGINIIGLGDNENRPVITFITSTAASLVVAATNISIRNIVFKCNIASQVTMLDVNSTNFHVDGCSFLEGTETGLNFIDIDGGAANACDNALVTNSEFYTTTAGNYNNAVELAEVADHVHIKGNYIYGYFPEGGIYNPTGNVLTNINIENNIIHNVETAAYAIRMVSAVTGTCIGNRMYSSTDATIIDPGSLKCMDNLGSTGIDAAGSIFPATTSVGSEFSIVKVMTSSDIPNNTQTAGELTTAATGKLLIKDIIVQTDAATGFAGPTSIEISTDNVNGLSGAADPSAVGAIALFGAKKTFIASTDGSVKSFPLILESGKKLYIHGDDAAGTGAGTGQVTIICQSLESGATISSS